MFFLTLVSYQWTRTSLCNQKFMNSQILVVKWLMSSGLRIIIFVRNDLSLLSNLLENAKPQLQKQWPTQNRNLLHPRLFTFFFCFFFSDRPRSQFVWWVCATSWRYYFWTKYFTHIWRAFKQTNGLYPFFIEMISYYDIIFCNWNMTLFLSKLSVCKSQKSE